MAPAFGFAVGDFISTIALIAKVSRALQTTGGAASDYQQVRIELDSLQRILQHLERLEPYGSNTNHVNAVRAIALACKVPLQNFLDNLEKFESSLGPFASNSLRSSGRKVQYSLFLTKEVDKLRAFVGAKVISINLLLSMRYM